MVICSSYLCITNTKMACFQFIIFLNHVMFNWELQKVECQSLEHRIESKCLEERFSLSAWCQVLSDPGLSVVLCPLMVALPEHLLLYSAAAWLSSLLSLRQWTLGFIKMLIPVTLLLSLLSILAPSHSSLCHCLHRNVHNVEQVTNLPIQNNLPSFQIWNV